MDKYFNRNDIVNGYKIVTMIGQGRYGIAYLAINKFGQKCVVKQLRNEMLKITRDSVIYEERILKTLNSSRFPKFISEFRDEFRQGYLLEYIDGIVFHDFMAQQDDNNQCCQCAASPCDYSEVNFDHSHTGCSPGGRNMIL